MLVLHVSFSDPHGMSCKLIPLQNTKNEYSLIPPLLVDIVLCSISLPLPQRNSLNLIQLPGIGS